MKQIFIVLLAANILFLGYALLGDAKKAEATPERTRADIIDGRYAPLQLVSERDAKTKTQNRGKNTATEPAATVVDADKQCLLIGPYIELLHAEYLVERLHSFDIAAEIKHIEITDGKNFWVYLKPEMSEKEALRRLYEIQAKSIDSYIIPTGELANGISFGQFSEIGAATEKADQVRAQGYVPEIKEIAKSHTEVWVEVKPKKEQKISDEQWLDLLKEEKTVEKRQNYCLGIAN